MNNIIAASINKIDFKVTVVLCIQLILSVYLSLELNIWIDEAWTLDTTGRDLKYALWQSINGELQAPLYFILLKLWRYMNASIIFARLFSIVAVLLAGISCVELSKRYFNNVSPAYIILSVSLNPFAIWASSEIRLYALVILLVCIHLILFHHIFIAEMESKISMFLYVIASLVGIYVQYYFGFLILSNFLWILQTRNQEMLKKFSTVALIIAAGMLPIVMLVSHQFHLVSGGASSGETFYYHVQVIYGQIKTFILPIYWMGQVPEKYLFLFVLLLFTILVLKNRKSMEAKHKALFVQIVVLVLSLVFTIRFTGSDLMEPRHMAVLFIPLILGVWTIFDNVSGRFRLYILNIWVFLFVICYAVTLIDTYRPMAKAGDWKRAATYIMENERPGEPIIVFLKDGILPLKHYYKGRNHLVPIPSEINLSAPDLKSNVLEDERQIFEAIRRAGTGWETLWILNSGACKYMGTDFHCEVLEEFIRKYYVVNTTQEYFRVKIRRVELRKKIEDLSL